MSFTVPPQILNGLSSCRTQLQHNEQAVEKCVADMVSQPDADLTGELERLTVEGAALKSRLGMFETAAMIASEQQQSSEFNGQLTRLTERCEAAVEFSALRTELAGKLDQCIDAFKTIKRDYDQADEAARIALWQAASLGLSYDELSRQSVDGSCRAPMVEEIAQVLLRYHYEQSPAAAAKAREDYVRSVVADLQRAAPVDAAA
jgi:hypothetical protein